MLLQLRSGHGGADPEAAGLLLDLAQLGNALDVDQQRRLDHVGSHLHQQVGAAGQHTCLALFRRQQRDRLVERLGRLVTHVHGWMASWLIGAED